ncbi:hypothetical protein ACIQ2D_07965 [Lysinibacillus sp. NPDC097287]|uniref:hypothetical protein n=1 Tax=Lysinibacillus sp. NPDC097287 TaxID=3364144 RepID=UPI0037F52C8C
MEKLTIVVKTLEYKKLRNENLSLAYEKTEKVHGISRSECVEKYYEKVNQYKEIFEAEKNAATASKIAHGLTMYEFSPNPNVAYYVELHKDDAIIDTQSLGWVELDGNFDEDFMRRELQLVLSAVCYPT